MKRTALFLLSATLSIGLIGCTPKEEQAAENAGDTMAQKSENAAENTGNAMENAGEAMGNAAEGAGNAVGNAAESVTNAGVTAKVKNAINLSPVVKNTASHINVDTTDTQVIVKGSVHTQPEADEVVRLAKANAGTREVVNQLKVEAH